MSKNVEINQTQGRLCISTYTRSKNKTKKIIKKTRGYPEVSELVCSCFEPSQPLGATPGLNTNSNLSLSYTAHKSFSINHDILQYNYFKHTHTHT